MLDEIYAEVKQHLANSIDAMKRDLSSIRTGRATSSLLDGVRVDYYGTSTPANYG